MLPSEHPALGSRSWEEIQTITPDLFGDAHLPNLFDYTRPFVLHRADDFARVTVPALPEVGDEAYSFAVKVGNPVERPCLLGGGGGGAVPCRV